MNRPDEETLMAYADGALDDAKRAEVERQIAGDPQALRTVEMFRRTSRLAQEAFSAPMTSAPPEALVTRIMTHPAVVTEDEPAPRTAAAAEPIRAGGTIVPIEQHRRSLRPARFKFSLPLAASLALAVGMGAGYLLTRGVTGDEPVDHISVGPVAPGSAMARLLETRGTGEPIERAVVVATFRDRNDRICREVELLGANARPEFAGVACRQPGRGWLMEGAVRLSSVRERSGGGYAPSGANEKDVLEALLSALGAKPALTPVEEKTLRVRGWE
jgi:hypothetical protein